MGSVQNRRYAIVRCLAWRWQKENEPNERMMERNEKGRSQPEEDIRKEYDPYKEDPGAGNKDDVRVEESRERDARQREGIGMNSMDRLDKSATSPVIDTGLTGQTTRGSYGSDSSTGQGTYVDRTADGSADISTDPVERTADRLADEWNNQRNDDERAEA